MPIGKAALGVIQLGRGHSQIKQHTVCAIDTQLIEDLSDAIKITVYQRYPVGVVRQPLLCRRNGRFVTVYANQTAGSQALHDLQRMTGPA